MAEHHKRQQEADKRRQEQIEIKRQQKEERRRKIEEERKRKLAQQRERELQKRATQKQRLQETERKKKKASGTGIRSKSSAPGFKKPMPKNLRRDQAGNRPKSRHRDPKRAAGKTRPWHQNNNQGSGERKGWISYDTIADTPPTEKAWAVPKPKKKKKPAVRQYHCLKGNKKRYPVCQNGEEQYVMSDYDSEFESEPDEPDNSKRERGKRKPTWAMRDVVSVSVREQGPIDTDSIFGPMISKSVELTDVFPEAKFGNQKTKYRTRGLSGDWTRDRLTWHEERTYKKSVGWV